ncbi:AAA family ATPase [Sphingobacterium lactis]|uniref:AAA family ATPase n=1 Tax=Sphingobacterium lactis TaxID=797291 RepID=UPI003F7F9F2D
MGIVKQMDPIEIQRAVNQSLAKVTSSESNSDLLSLLNKSELTPDSKFDKPETVLSIVQPNGEVPMFVRGSISQINGKAKSGKSTFLTLAVSSAINGDMATEEFSLVSPGGIKAIWFDTEQGGYYAYRTYSMTLGRLTEGNEYNLKYYDLREYNAEQRVELIKFALELHSDVGLVVIDGTRDLLYDYNDPKESSKLVTELMRLSTVYNCHIVNVLHLNKSNGESRGHLGTELDNKCTLTMVVNKNEEMNGAIIETKLNRDAPILPFELVRDDFGNIYLKEGIINNKTKAEPITLRYEDHKTILENVFSTANEFNSGQFNQALKKSVSNHIGKTAPDLFIRTLVAEYQEKGFVLFEGGGNKRCIKLVEFVDKLPN